MSWTERRSFKTRTEAACLQAVLDQLRESREQSGDQRPAVEAAIKRIWNSPEDVR